MRNGDPCAGQALRAAGLDRGRHSGLAALDRLPLRLFDILAIIFLVLALLALLLAYVVGPTGATNAQGITNRRAGPFIVFAGSDFDVRLRIEGATLPVCGTSGPQTGSAVAVVIDHSGSMGGGGGSPLETAKAAAQSFVDHLSVGPTGDAMAVIQFDDSAQILSDRKSVV